MNQGVNGAQSNEPACGLQCPHCVPASGGAGPSAMGNG